MRPSFLDNMSWTMAEVYGAVTDRILINLARHFPYVKPGEELPGSFEYQARMLAQMGRVNRETADIILQSLGGADAALRGALEAAILEALKSEEPALRKAAEQGLLGSFMPPEVSPGMMQAFKTYYQQSADKLNLVNTVMLESTESAYRATVADITARIQRTQNILNTAAGEVVTGVTSWNQAMRDGVRRMVENGLTGFVDHGGHRWSPEAYVAMDIRTTMFNTAREAIGERAEEYGCDLYKVSSHNGARPLCYPWQGKVISRSGWTGTVEDLDGNKVTVHSESEIESFRYGGGLFGVNCGHYPMVFVPGFSTIKGEPQSPEENEKTYEESQQQRALERKVRAEKRDLEVLKAQGASPEQIQAQQERVKKASDDVQDFCDKTGRARHRDREFAPVNAKFPNPDTYDVSEFPTEQRDRIREWTRNGDRMANSIAQSGPEKVEFGELFDREKSMAAVETIDKRVRGLYGIDERLAFVGDVRVSRDLPLDMDAFDLHDEYKNLTPAAAQYLPWGNAIGGGRPIIEVHAENWGYDNLRDMFDAIYDIRQRTSDPLITATYGAEGTLLHEYGHFVADYFGVFGSQRWNGAAADGFNRWLLDYWQNHDTSIISKYAASSHSELFAEAFAQSFDTEHPDLSATKMANEIMKKFHEYIGINPGR